jgi:MinD superfamily P-loop ATPase
MKIAIASGKGGTGKTTVSASLTHVWPRPVVAVDLDVEEPNLHLFLKPQITHRDDAFLEIPEADESKCTHCMACVDICQFKAITVMADTLLIFPEMCHGCGGCLAVCPEGALRPGQRKLGEVSRGKVEDVEFIMGRLRVGEAMSPPLMRVVKRHLDDVCEGREPDVIIDAPPGVSCPAVSAVMDSDLIVLVTEPTPFGNYDLQLAVKAFSTMGIPMVVVVNRDGLGDRAVYEFCRRRNLPILAKIPYDSDIARSYANGRIIAAESPALTALFTDMATRILEMGAIGPEVAHG